MAIIGNTVRITIEFKSFDDELTSPDNVTIRVYDGNNTELTEEELSPVSEGKYQYDYTIPSDGPGPLLVEFTGTLEDTPIVARETISRSWH